MDDGGSKRGSGARPTPRPAVRGGVATAGDALLGRRLDGRYEIRAVIARGGMATVYLALDERLDREVAVKVMHPALAHDEEFVARFQREARAAARIAHPNVVGVSDAGTDGDVVFLVMEYVRGQTLRALLDGRGRLSPGESLEVLEQMLSALDAAHAAGVVHRDVKPENVLIAVNGTVKVADFGLARAVEASTLTQHSGLLLGTVAYVAPEQVTRGTSDARSDVYAAGVVLYEMLTGTPPFTAETPLAVAWKHVNESVPAASASVAGVPSEVDDLLAAATCTDPAERFPDASAFLTATRQARRRMRMYPARSGDTAALHVGDNPHAQTAGAGAVTTALTLGALAPAGAASSVNTAADTVVVSRITPDAAITMPPTTAAPGRTPPASAGPARRRRRRWPWVLLVLLVALSVAAGVTGWVLGRSTNVHVPAVQGMSVAAAMTALRADHLSPVLGSSVHSDTVATSLVAATVPAQGASAKRGAQVEVEPSLGVLDITVPSLTGDDQTAALAALHAAGLSAGTITAGYSDTVPSGQFISSTPKAGLSVDHRTPVAMVFSSGPAPVTVPNVQSDPQASATTTLQSLGLTVTSTQAYSTTVQSGDVIAQSLPPGTTTHRTEGIGLVISKGPQLVAVPNLYSLSGSAARASLTSLGLTYKEHDLFPGGRVLSQSPGAGTLVAPGTKVSFTTF